MIPDRGAAVAAASALKNKQIKNINSLGNLINISVNSQTAAWDELSGTIIFFYSNDILMSISSL